MNLTHKQGKKNARSGNVAEEKQLRKRRNYELTGDVREVMQVGPFTLGQDILLGQKMDHIWVGMSPKLAVIH